VSLGPLAAGLGKGYSSPAIASLQEPFIRNQPTNYSSFSVSDQEASWVASLSLLGALFGGMFGGLAMQHGRKRVLAVISLPFSLSWVITVFAKSVETLFITAFIGGFCCAIVNLCTQVGFEKVYETEWNLEDNVVSFSILFLLSFDFYKFFILF
jgi:MFS family permease